MDEHLFIHELLTPLCHEGHLLNDCGKIYQGKVISSDSVVANVHFIEGSSAGMIAYKALARAVSDLAAAGATPEFYQLLLYIPQEYSCQKWLNAFCCELKTIQEKFNIKLSGGDTTYSPTLAVGVTVIGSIPEGEPLSRTGAAPGDGVFVSGTIGDAALGLELALKQKQHPEFLLNRYHFPEPRLAMGQVLRGLASSCMDISDGLVLDLQRLCAASKVGATVYAHHVPLSEAYKNYTASLTPALSGGDDYELLFTAPVHQQAALQQMAKTLTLPITRIGTINEGEGVQVIDAGGVPVQVEKTGHMHF